MNLGLIVKNTVSKIKFNTVKHSPELLLGAGIATGVAAGVLACRASFKAKDVLDEREETIEEIIEDEKLTEVEKEEAVKNVNKSTIEKCIKLYSVPVVLGLTAGTEILGSYKIISDRNVGLSVTCASLQTAYNKLRENVRDEFGEDKEKELVYGVKKETIETEELDENGKSKKKKEEVMIGNCKIAGYGPYTAFYDDGCKGWSKDAERNKAFLTANESYWNAILNSKGYVFLNDILKSLGIPTTKAGQVVGWRKAGPDEPIVRIDFGIFDYWKESSRDFVNGYERTILLDFNCRGNVWLDMEEGVL